MEKIKALDEAMFWWINNHHNDVLDWIMWGSSQKWCWFGVMIAAFILVTLRHDRKSWLWVIIGFAACFLLADQISNIIKDGVQRLRPCHALEEVRMFHTHKGGLYGFVSSHASNAFAVAMFLSLMYGRKRKKRTSNKKEEDVTAIAETSSPYRSALLPWLVFLWAVVCSYSRPYLGKHYPGDVLCGAMLGLGIGALVYFVIAQIRRRISSRASA